MPALRPGPVMGLPSNLRLALGPETAAEAAEQIDQRGLSRTGKADDGDKLALLDFEVKIIRSTSVRASTAGP